MAFPNNTEYRMIAESVRNKLLNNENGSIEEYCVT